MKSLFLDMCIQPNALGRIYTVPPSNDECFHLGLLLVNVCVPTSFEYLRSVNGEFAKYIENSISVYICSKITFVRN